MILRPGLFPRLSVGGISILQTAALLLPIALVVFERGNAQAQLLAVALLTAIFWDLIFAILRKRKFYFHGVSIALIVAVLVPPTLPLWQLALTLSLGCVIGEHVFGGRGFGFLSPAAICLSLLLLSFPQVQLEPMSQNVALATVPGALLLLISGLVSWRVILGAFVMIVGLALPSNLDLDVFSFGIATLFGLVFVTGDPVSAASTNPGRWIYGLLAGLLISIFSPDSTAITSASLVFGSLTASVFAPLIDHLIVLAKAKRRLARSSRRGRRSLA